MLSLFFLLTSFHLFAQSSSSISTIANVNKIIQDSKGFIWLVGQTGLTRYDGNQSITFSSANKTWPLPVSWLHDIDVVNDHFLLASETDGLWLFNPDTGQSQNIITDIPRKSLYHAAYFDGDYYINAPNKFYRYNVKTHKTQLIHHDISIKQVVHNKMNLYLSSTEGLFQLNHKKNRLQQLLDEPILAITALSTGVIASTESRLYFIDFHGKKSAISVKEKIYAIAKEFNTKNFFTLSNTGTIKRYSGETLVELPHNFGNTLPTRARSMLHDSSGVLWISSTEGIVKLSEQSIINHPKTFDININANEITTLNNQIIIGSYGLGLQNFTTPIFKHSVNDNFTKNALRISTFDTIDKQLYIGTFDGIWIYNEEINGVEKLDIPENNKLILLLKHQNNLLYVGTNYHGVFIYDLSTKKIIKHIDANQGLSSTEIIDILPLNNQHIWLATSAGVDIVDTNSNQIKKIDLPGLSKVISLIEADNKIFASTMGSGIFVFNKQGDLIARFAQGSRFSSMKLINDEVWVAGRPGLYRFNPKTNQITMIENTEHYSFVGSMVLLNNMVYASHYGGVLSLNIKPVKKFSPKVYISKTTISGKSYLMNKSIQIESGNDVITIDIASLDYRPGAPKQFQYRLNNSNWNRINGNQLTLTGLASGRYNIEIMATNSLGQWSDFKAYTNINVAYPWYWTPYVKILYVVILTALIILTIWLLYLRSKSISYIHKTLTNDNNDLNKVALQVKRNLFSVVNLLSENKIEESREIVTQCLDYLTNNQPNEPKTLEGKTLSVALPFFANYLKHKYQVNLTFQLNTPDDSLSEELQADLYRVIFEAITSVIIKDAGRNFSVHIKIVRQKIWLNISDDYQGFINFDSKINFDISMYYIRQIVNKHHGIINCFDEHGEGSRLILSLPLK